MTRRDLLAGLVIVVGGTLWIYLPDMQGGSLRDDTNLVRWRLKPGRALAAWVLVENPGTRTITLTGASLGDDLPDGVELLGTRARIGEVVTIDDAYPGPPGPFRSLTGFKIPPDRGATIGFGLSVPEPGTVTLSDVRVTYREHGDATTLRIRHTAQLCVAVNPREC